MRYVLLTMMPLLSLVGVNNGLAADSVSQPASTPPAIAEKWDAAAEFSATDNPNGVWTYAFGRDGGEMMGLNGSMKMKVNGIQNGLFIMKEMKGDGTLTGLAIGNMSGTRFGISGIVGWKGTPYPGADPEWQLQHGNNEYWCVVAKNTTGADIVNIVQYPSFRGWTAPANKLILNSCNDKYGDATRNIVQFKAPRAGRYTFRAVWTDLKVKKETYVDISCLVYEKGVRNLPLGGRLCSKNNWIPVVAVDTIDLEANDTIWFCNQNNNRYVVDNQVSLELTVTLLSSNMK